MDKFTKVFKIFNTFELEKLSNDLKWFDYDIFILKGVALIRSNDRIVNLGRYWPKTGPQVTIYTPSAFVSKASRNTVFLIELEGSDCQNEANCYIEFLDYPLIDSLPSKNF
jgi:hypothetical protein